MFKEIVQNIRNLSRNPVEVDPSQFDDPVATATGWGPAKRGGSNFCTHKFVEVNPNRIEFRPSVGAKLFSMIFLLIGLGLSIGFSYKLLSKENIILTTHTIFPILFGLVFAIVGVVMFYFFLSPIVFDKYSGYFWKGRRGPDQVVNKDKIKDLTRLDEIHALQLISEYVRSSGKNSSSYYSYELNLVLADASRVNVVDHGIKDKLIEDAQTLAEFLDVPVWDAT